MMLAALALMIQAPASVAPPVQPAEWAQLPPLPWRVPPRYDGEMARFVMEEVRAGRCVAAVTTATGQALQVDVALLIASDGRPRAIVPRAIGCATVEQYTSGLISRAVRENLIPDVERDTWYRASITFHWPS
ncbi:hypothetical protein SAMN05192583_0020 [Sphingomonas gellani]|uniref:TonB protein C-terminal n=1 Tax=Sphingomonas gellani TaxID=1166340 RepID=A0A1H7Y001_9SPHN|nr:hypothetical protein [Sphingomonas gellani]SEM39255.1 hypothetical protein SAMN05192583_0020 [Sphingomonas gellani]